jgi:hypothetical protein
MYRINPAEGGRMWPDAGKNIYEEFDAMFLPSVEVRKAMISAMVTQPNGDRDTGHRMYGVN